jgi:hypothetical protein
MSRYCVAFYIALPSKRNMQTSALLYAAGHQSLREPHSALRNDSSLRSDVGPRAFPCTVIRGPVGFGISTNQNAALGPFCHPTVSRIGILRICHAGLFRHATQALLEDNTDRPFDPSDVTTAVFYSISSTQPGACGPGLAEPRQHIISTHMRRERRLGAAVWWSTTVLVHNTEL